MNKIYFLFLACVAAGNVWAQRYEDAAPLMVADPVQHCSTVDAGPDVTITGKSAIIGPSVSIPGATYSWSPTTFLSNPNSASTKVIKPGGLSDTVTYTYTLTMTANKNLVTNGDFTQGNTGFASQYTYISPGTAGVPDQYTITLNPIVMNNQWCDFIMESGNLMAVDGSVWGTDRSFWSQSIPVQPNTNYTFGFDAVSLWYGAPATIGGVINGTTVIQEGLTTTCGWQQPQTVWNSGNSTVANITLYSFTTDYVGNDFAVDNIRLLTKCLPSTDAVNVTFVGSGTAAAVEPAVNGLCTIYPNPTQRSVNVQLSTAWGEGGRIEIRDLNGKVVRSIIGGSGIGANVPVDLQGLPGGIYTISVRYGGGVITKRLAVK